MGRIREACYRHDMTGLVIMALLAEVGPLSLKQLAARVGLTPDGVYSAMHRLRDLGLVQSVRPAGPHTHGRPQVLYDRVVV